MTPQTPAGIGRVMQSVGRRYVRYFNDTYRRSGTLWEGRYRATLIDSEAYLFTCYRYIELNPVRAGLVAGPADYPWSSYGANALGRRDALVRPHARYSALGTGAERRRSAYRALFLDAIDAATLCRVRESTHTGWALGDDRFRLEITKQLNRRAYPAPLQRLPV
jgi:putative transposase